MHTARFTVITPECVRMEYSPPPGGRFVDSPTLFAAHRAKGLPTHLVGPADPECVIETGRMVVRYRPNGRPFGPDNLGVEVRGGPEAVCWQPGMVNQRNLGGALQTLDGVRGRVPVDDGILSRDGWYLVNDSKGHILTHEWVGPYEPGAGGEGTDWYLFGYGDDYAAGLRALTAVAGAVPMPRRYALGSWYSRYWPYTSAEFKQIVAEYEHHGFPLDVMVLDMDWHRQGWTGWSWNRALLPDAEDLLEWFHEQGLFVTLNLHPADGVGPHENAYEAFMLALGEDPSSRLTVPFDAGSKHYMEALFRRVHEPLEESGVDFWWLDWQQSRFTRSIPDLENLRWLNLLYYRHMSRHGARGMSFSRWAGLGDHRHPIHFSGDAHTGWASLAFQVPFTAMSGNAGCFFWSHDIGGHYGPRNEEATARWVQFGALSAALRLHSARSGALDRRPWVYESRYVESMRRAFALRSELMPHIYTAVRACHSESLPLIRPMYLQWPRAEAAFRSGQQYLLGEHLLVAPVVGPGMGARRVGVQAVWAPGQASSSAVGQQSKTSEGTGADARTGGEAWYNWFTGERYEVGGEVLVAAEIDEIPLLAAGGVLIPTRPATMRMTTEPVDELVLRCFPGVAGRMYASGFYEDDGITREYEKGTYGLTRLRAAWQADSVRVEIDGMEGQFNGQVAQRSYVVEVAAIGAVHEAVVDGQAAPPPEADFDAAHGVARVRVAARPVHEPVVVEVRFTPADHGAVAERHRARRIGAALGEAATGMSARQVLAAEWARRGRGGRGHGEWVEGGWAQVLAIVGGIGLRDSGPDEAGCRFYNSIGLVDEGKVTVTVLDRVGKDERVLARHELVVPAARTGLIPAPAAELALPELGLRASRIVRAQFSVGGEPMAVSLEVLSRTRPLGAWLVAGPFAFDPTVMISRQDYGPEQWPFSPDAKYPTTMGEHVGWRKGVSGEIALGGQQWTVDLRRMFGSRAGAGLAYGVTHVYSAQGQRARLVIESGDRVETWFNDQKVFSMDAMESVDGGGVDVELNPGWNRILIKTSEGGGGWGWRVSLHSQKPVRESATGTDPGMHPA